jgi:GNAT superfamily N-acetyltransferase
MRSSGSCRPRRTKCRPLCIWRGSWTDFSVAIQRLSDTRTAAHDEYATAIRSQVKSLTLFAVQDADRVIAFFSLEASPSSWWPTDKIPALYLAGMVVDRSARRRGIGSFILGWSVKEAARLGFPCVRLDCHADNLWLRRYYEDRGFTLRGQVEQHAGYYGCMRWTPKVGR